MQRLQLYSWFRFDTIRVFTARVPMISAVALTVASSVFRASERCAIGRSHIRYEPPLSTCRTDFLAAALS